MKPWWKSSTLWVNLAFMLLGHVLDYLSTQVTSDMAGSVDLVSSANFLNRLRTTTRLTR